MKEHTKKRVRRLLAGAVTVSMALALIPNIAGKKEIRAAWEKNQGNTQLGVSQIKGPKKDTTDQSEWTGSYVYFGKYVEGEKSSPIRFRVLAPTTDKYGGTTMFLDSDSSLFVRSFDDSSNIWYDEVTGESCELREYLNKDFLSGSFTDAEQAAIAVSYADTHDLVEWKGGDEDASFKVAFRTGIYGKYVGINEKIFVLDAEEASNCEYGYNVTDVNCTSRKKIKVSSAGSWWLRSAYSDNSFDAGCVRPFGFLGGYVVNYADIGVAPALNINQSSIIFSSLISGTSGEYGAEYKLTVADPKIKIAVPAGKDVTASGKTITVPYAISGDNAGTATRASVLILDKKYEAGKTNNTSILYYDTLSGTFSNSSATTGTFTLPDNLKVEDWGTGYYVYILAEDVNDMYETDYASTPVKISIPYTVTYEVANGTWSDGTTAPKTETVASGSSPASVPTGMIASVGFENGAWDTNPSGATITGATTFTYTFDEIPTYTVTYEVVNGTWADGTTAVKTETVARDASPANVPTGMIASSSFEGGSWDSDPSTATITGATTFTYSFDAIPTYTVTYEVVNGTWADGTTAVKTETVARDASPASVPTGMIASSGFENGAWDTDPSTATISGDTTFTYTFDAIPTYTVTYEVVNGTWADGTTAPKTETVARDASPASVPTGMIASSGFENGAWDTDPSTATISGDTTFTYTFAPVDTYIVTVQSDGNGTASADVTYGATGTEVTLTATPSAGYQFKEWQVISGGVTITNNKFTIGTENVVVKAIFEEVPATTYTVTFETNGGSAIASQKVEDGNKATKPADPTKEGYTFEGWYKDAALTVAYDFETAITADITLYAKWTQKAQISYTVVSGADGSWKLGSGTDYTLTVKRSEDDPSCIDHFTGVQTDGAALVKDSHYTAKPGSTVITLKNSYLESLSEGKHTITVNFDDGSVSLEITVQAADKKEVTLIPKTGETGCIAVLGAIMILSAAGCVITLEREKRRRRSAR